ncbi:hypothetical protein CN535_04320 [Bacillus pseudomycoides]|nr:hypothetical protein BLX05_10855 [Bacillus pseudomycoides]PDY13298.1 hypothetical protein COO16_06530 [Bacillus pseudomycoides]PEM41817.1 hypothetical protein CN634_01100 [Bacillus pseudomycoides]PEU48689.1 hypothetical protein CN535_04320 [Bacillus pseudomycoides]PFY14480.1 hypothetical protein COL42_18470 [Bacillus pseudomycoides]
MNTLQLVTDIMKYCYIYSITNTSYHRNIDRFNQKLIILGLLLCSSSSSESLFEFANHIWALFLSKALGGMSAACMMLARFWCKKFIKP